jgi:hypothetical protein
MPVILQAEHGVDSSARSHSRRLSGFKRGKRWLLGGWRRSDRLLCGWSLRGGRLGGSYSDGSGDARGGSGWSSSGWLGRKLLEIGEIARFFRARLNGGK